MENFIYDIISDEIDTDKQYYYLRDNFLHKNKRKITSNDKDNQIRLIMKLNLNDSDFKVLNALLTNCYKEFIGFNIKNEMLKQTILYLSNYINPEDIILLDLGSGVGNDVHRWIFNNIKKIIGIDNSQNQIGRAISRTAPYNKLIKVSYLKGSIDDEKEMESLLKNKKFYLISANYCINHVKLENFMKIVSKRLCTNGILIGIATDGDVLNGYFKSFGSDVNSRLFSCKTKTNITNEYKKPYVYTSLDSYINDVEKIPNLKDYEIKYSSSFFNSDYVSEKIIYKDELEKIAKKYDLIPYTTCPNVLPIQNLRKIPVQQMFKDRPKELAYLHFQFSFIKASEQLLKNIEKPNPLFILKKQNQKLKTYLENKKIESILLIDEYELVENILKNNSNNYFVIFDNLKLPDDDLINEMLQYPVNPIHLSSSIKLSNNDIYNIEPLKGIVSISREHLIKIKPKYFFESFETCLQYGIGYTYPKKGFLF